MGRGLTDFKVLTFDCYGTLIDWESGIWDALQPLIMFNLCNDLTRDLALASYARHESKLESERPELIYSDILQRVHAALAFEFGLKTRSDLDADFSHSVANWPALPDTADALRYLKTQFKLVILSNIDHSGIAASQRKIGVDFDAIYTAQDIGSYKPSAANFDYLLKHLDKDFGIQPQQILHTAQSLFHDHAPAREIGLANAWVDRQRLSQQGSWGATAPVANRPLLDYTFYSMAELADAVQAELSQESI